MLQMAFIKADEARNGMPPIKAVLEVLGAMNVTMPRHVLNFFLIVLSGRGLTKTSGGLVFDGEAPLNFQKLQQLLQIFYRCPVSTKAKANNSANMHQFLSMPGHENDIDT